MAAPKEEVYVEIAELRGFHDGAWIVGRPGEDSFEEPLLTLESVPG
ncbi:hypothetical protein [Arthrobacter sp. M4]|nr:hypothetical protein [Arthrobacter sp. M4]MCA4135711.1 hypothetical protein [Arthrobacter sp. M4]